MKRLIILSLLLVSLEGMSQVNTFFFSDWSAESQWNYNPALQSKEKVFIYLPALSGFSFSAGHTGFSYDDAIQDNTLSFTNLIEGLDEKNHLLQDINSTLFALGVKFGNVQLRTGVSLHTESRLTYTKDLLELAWKGNGHPDLIGRRLSMDGMGFNTSSYLSYFVGGSASLLDNKLNLGLNAKFYNGIGTVFTEQSTFGILTDEDDYTITVDGSYDLRASGASDLADFNDIDLSRVKPLSVEGNRGFGVDVGFTYTPVEKFTLEASATNLGSIKWTQDTEGYSLNDQEIAYSGFDLGEFVSSVDSTQSSIEQFTDSITELFTPEENTDNFTTKMNRNIFLAGTISFTKRSKITGYFSSKNRFGETTNSVGGMYSKDFGRAVQLRGGLQLFNMNDLIVPLGFILNAGPVQVGLHSDNLLSVISWKKTKYVSGKFSVSFRFGKEARIKKE